MGFAWKFLSVLRHACKRRNKALKKGKKRKTIISESPSHVVAFNLQAQRHPFVLRHGLVVESPECQYAESRVAKAPKRDSSL
jgi:hypothetical protein